ncbi:MAG: T9SS type A sorting domain-containing protein [Ignavibacteria bacterium]|nr:T9SS type A sorting domain-containing protein [Ignavibacteria bacterium]
MIRILLISLVLLVQTPFVVSAQLIVHDVHFYVRPLSADSNLSFTKRLSSDEFRERLAGDIRLDAIQLRVIIKCTSETPIDTTRVRYRITNDATGKIVYNTSRWITLEALQDTLNSGMSLCDSNGRAVPLTTRTYAMAPDEFVIVRMPPFEPAEFLDDVIGRLSFDAIALDAKDTVRHLAYKVRRLSRFTFPDLSPYTSSLSIMRSSGAIIPSPVMFVNGGTTVSSFEKTGQTLHRNTKYEHVSNSDSLLNPVIRFDRRNEQGAPYQGVVTGDTLTSFPINLSRLSSATLSISARRAYPHGLTHRRWMNDTLYGPEPTSMWENIEYPGDSLVIVLLKPSPDQLNGIINTVDSNWIEQPVMKTALAMREPNYQDRFDVFTIPIPDSILKSPNDGARNFRFRIMLKATARTAYDDDDPWDVDRIDVLVDDQRDLSISDVEVPLAYSVIPYKQAALAPLRVRLVNHTQNQHRRVRLRVEAYSVRDTLKRTVIERFVDSFNGLEQRTIDMPPFNLSAVTTSDSDTVILKAMIYEGNDTSYVDEVIHNNTIYRKLPVHLSRSLAYDNYESEGHHVVAQEAGRANNFGLRAPGGNRNDDSISRYGGTDTPANTEPGGISMSFTVSQRDTIFGYQFAFDRDEPRLATCFVTLVRFVQSSYQQITDASLTLQPGRDDSGVVTDTIGTYSLPVPIALEPGTYKLTLHQVTHEGLNLCATSARAGVVVQTAIDRDPELGAEIIADPSWFVDTAQPSFPFRYESTTATGRIFVGDHAYRSYTYGDFGGRVNGAFTFRRGTFVPVMRVVLGHRSDSIPTSVDAVAVANNAPLISLYPNPASSVLTTSVIGGGEIDVSIITMQGERIFSQRIRSMADIDVSMLASGQYLIHASDGRRSHTQTFCVMR